MKLRALTLTLLSVCVCRAATVAAASCTQANVSTAITSAATGDTVTVPAGTCTWTGFTIAKAITLQGAGTGSTNITLSGNTITKQASGVIRVKGFSFSKSSGGNESKGWTITGAWQGVEPVIFEYNAFTIDFSGLILVQTPGGVIFAHNSFTSGINDSFLQLKDPTDPSGSWTSADTLGTRDTDGKKNIYVEDNTFYGSNAQGIDADDSSRIVYRYNTLTYSAWNSHGLDSSAQGIRHFEVYNNTFQHTPSTDEIANQNWAIWVRGGTGVIYGNTIPDLAGGYWGDKTELRFSIRGAEDIRPQGTCGQVSYPVPRQIGQNHNGTSYFTDPIYIWSNVGTMAIGAGFDWGNPCGFTFSTFWQEGRDYVLNTPRPGYTAYTYPHPLVGTAPGGGGGGGSTGPGKGKGGKGNISGNVRFP
jgi:hypothetical protein